MPALAQLLDAAGVMLGAVSGALAAGRKGLDWLGVLIVAGVTAVGGGSLRDVLLDRHPVFWMAHPNMLWLIAGAVGFTLLWVRFFQVPDKALQVADAFSLAFFSIGGARIAVDAGVGAPVVLVLGTMTGVAGGVFRDVLCNRIPLLLQRGTLYGSAALAGIAVFLLLRHWQLRHAALAGMACVAALRLLALTFDLRLPVFKLK